MSCRNQHSGLLTTTQQLRAVHEYTNHPKQFGFYGTCLHIDQPVETPRILDEDDRTVAWIGPLQIANWRRFPRRTPENCAFYERYVTALSRGYVHVAHAIARLCGIMRHAHILDQGGPHGRQVYPSARYLPVAAKKAKIIVLDTDPLDQEFWLEPADLAAAADASEWAAWRSVLSSLLEIVHHVDDEQIIAEEALQRELDIRLPHLDNMLAAPIQPGDIWDPSRFPPTADDSLEVIRQAPFDMTQILNGIKSERMQRTAKILPLTARVSVVGRNGHEQPRLRLQRDFTPADMSHLTKRQVIVATSRLDKWASRLESWGLAHVCWGSVLDAVPDRRNGGMMRWALQAGRQLIFRGIEPQQAVLAREVGVNRASISRNYPAILEGLERWRFLWATGPSLDRPSGVALEG